MALHTRVTGYCVSKTCLRVRNHQTVTEMKSTIFWDITPSTPLSVNRRSGGTYRLHLQGRKKVQQETSVEAICSSETSVDTQRTTWCYIPEDGTLHNQCCKNLKSYTVREIITLPLKGY
jgi:hypothetical protein